MQGARTVLVITKGFRDLLQIGTQSRPNIFDLKIQKPEQLFEAVVEASERVHVLSRELRAQPDPGFFGPNVSVERGVTGEEVRVLVPLDHDQVRRELTEHWVRGIRSVAVILLHSYDSAPLFVPPRITSRTAGPPWPVHFRTMSPHAVLLSPTQRRLDAETSGFHRYAFVQHEQAVAAIAKEIGYDNVSLSSEVRAWLATIPTTWRSKVQQCGDGAQRVATGDADGQGRAARLHRDSRRVPDAAHP